MHAHTYSIFCCSFEEFLDCIYEPTTVAAFKVVTRELLPLVAERHEINLQEAFPTPINSRKITVAYMSCIYPTHVFEAMGLPENEVVRTAAPLMACLDGIITSIGPDGSFEDAPFEKTEALIPAIKNFMTAFDTWQPADEEKLGTRILDALDAMYRAPQNERVDEQIERLRAKMMQLNQAERLRLFDQQRALHPF